MFRRGASPFTLLLLWSALVATALLSRPLLPVDETRYLSVAWEMWQRGDFLVPHLNGEPYSHKPPLLFWSMHLGWWLFGVNDWWPRLLSPLVSLVNLVLTWRLARLLWPGLPVVTRLAPWLLFGCLVWVATLTMVQFDQWLTLFTLIAFTGAVSAIRGRRAGWWLLAVGVGLGVLCKGPVMFVHVLPAVLLTPWWAGGPAMSRGFYYPRLFLALVAGIAIALCWAVPAAIAGGEVYRDAIFWHQTIGRTLGEVVHARPFWWYFAWLPVALLPWIAWPPVWRGGANVIARRMDEGVRFCIAWFIPVVLLMSLVGSKQIKYLLPALPALALLAARCLQPAGESIRLRAPGLLLVLGGMLIVVLGVAGPAMGLPDWSDGIAWQWGLLPVPGGLLIAYRRGFTLQQAVMTVGAAVVLFALVFQWSVFSAAAPAYDIVAVSERIGRLQRSGVPLANVAKYHGQYHFLGRLTEPVEAFLREDAPRWIERHPDGYLIVYYRQSPRSLPEAWYAQPYRGGMLAIWPAEVLAAHPEWLRTLPGIVPREARVLPYNDAPC